MEAETVVKIIVAQVLTRLGVLYAIQSGQGTQFQSSIFSEMCKLLGIKRTHRTPRHPKSDIMVERLNKMLAIMLSNYVDEHQGD